MESLRRQFEDMMCVIIDEMSLIGADFFYYIHKRMVEVTRNEEIFGNRAMLLVGDLLQIPPTKQTSIYSEPKTLQNKALYNSDCNLWDSCDTVHLTVNKRQGACEWRETLDRIRIGQMNEEDEKLLNSRRVSNEEHKDKNYDKALHLFFSNEEVCEHNKNILNRLEGDSKDIQADIRGYPKGCYPEIKYDTFVEDTRFQKYLTLKLGARVILNYNIDISDGLGGIHKPCGLFFGDFRPLLPLCKPFSLYKFFIIIRPFFKPKLYPLPPLYMSTWFVNAPFSKWSYRNSYWLCIYNPK